MVAICFLLARPLERLTRDATQNSMMPAAGDERFEDGRFRYPCGRAEAGRTRLIKLDSPIDPSLFAGDSGTLAVFDGEGKVAEVPEAGRHPFDT